MSSIQNWNNYVSLTYVLTREVFFLLSLWFLNRCQCRFRLHLFLKLQQLISRGSIQTLVSATLNQRFEYSEFQHSFIFFNLELYFISVRFKYDDTRGIDFDLRDRTWFMKYFTIHNICQTFLVAIHFSKNSKWLKSFGSV